MQRQRFIARIYKEHSTFLRNVCRSKVSNQLEYHDLIEDCIQETFLTASEAYETIRKHPNIRGWLLQTCMNRLMASLRAIRYRQSLQAFSLDAPDAPEIADEGGLKSAIKRNEAQFQLTQIRSVLSEEELEIFTSYFVENNTMHEVATIYAMKDEQVKNMIKRIRRKAVLYK